jgi:hypothetical protein
MLKRKILTISTATVMSFASLGLTAFTVHADTTKKVGNTVVSYAAQQVQPQEWGISVPATIDLSKDLSQTASSGSPGISNASLKYGRGTLSIVKVDEKGSPYEDPSKIVILQ